MLLNSSEQERRCSQTTHNPAKLPEVDTLVAKYGEAELLRMMRKKYSVASGGGWPGTLSGAPKPAGTSEVHLEAKATFVTQVCCRTRCCPCHCCHVA